MFDWFLTRRLERMGRLGNPDPAFVRSLGETLHVRAGGGVLFSRGWRLAAGTASMVTTLWAGTGVYAYASENVLPDSALYPMRESIEAVETRLAVTPELRARVQLKLLRRRMNEQAKLAARDHVLSARNAERFEQKMQETLRDLPRLSEDKKRSTLEQVTTLQAEYTDVLETAREQTTNEREKVRIEKMLEKLEDTTKIRPRVLNRILEKRLEEHSEVNTSTRVRTRVDAQHAVPPRPSTSTRDGSSRTSTPTPEIEDTTRLPSTR